MLDLRGQEVVRICKISLTKALSRTSSLAGLRCGIITPKEPWIGVVLA